MRTSIQLLLKQFNIQPKKYDLYEQAFTHSSYSYKHQLCNNYEKLEFLGDAVIELIVSEHLLKKHPEMNEGELSKERIVMVQSRTLAKASHLLQLPKLIRFGDSIKDKTNISENIVEDVFESFIGAVYLDQGLAKCYTILKRTIIHFYEIHSLNEMTDFKTMLQELIQKTGKHRIVYKTISHVLGNCRVELWIDNIKQATGIGNKIKHAQIQAARNAFNQLKKDK
ncbi:MAG: ribonuclease III [Mycoplasmataceae bacterium]|nr:ribonuclease III [Mycoplasmataceae bacterium]